MITNQDLTDINRLLFKLKGGSNHRHQYNCCMENMEPPKDYVFSDYCSKCFKTLHYLPRPGDSVEPPPMVCPYCLTGYHWCLTGASIMNENGSFL